jgi:hypothetical protein
MSVQGYSINEYGAFGNEQQPGPSAWYIARLERVNADGARANWGMVGQTPSLHDTLGWLVTANANQPMGQWWVYKRYADQTGQRTNITAGSTHDGIVFQDSAARKSLAVLGNRGGNAGTVTVTYNNMPSYLVTSGRTRVLIERMPSTNAFVSAPTVVSDSQVTLSGTTLTVTINWANALDAYAITLTPGSGGTLSINDNTLGTGQNQFNYTGTWSFGSQSGAFNSDNHWSSVTNNAYQVAFNGTRVQIYSARANNHGIFAVSIDGGAETNIDLYSATRVDQTLVWTSPTLSAGNHTVRVRVTGTRNASSSGNAIVADRVDITP